MLIVPIFVNERMVDTLFCHNQGEENSKGEHKYKVWLESKIHGTHTVWHKRSDGWPDLVIKAIEILK